MKEANEPHPPTVDEKSYTHTDDVTRGYDQNHPCPGCRPQDRFATLLERSILTLIQTNSLDKAERVISTLKNWSGSSSENNQSMLDELRGAISTPKEETQKNETERTALIELNTTFT